MPLRSPATIATPFPNISAFGNGADLEIDECYPFCGCLCGMHFQEASQMYYCIQCDTLTNFSELSPHDRDVPED